MNLPIIDQPATFGNNLPNTGANGLRPSDIVRYKSLTIAAKRIARNRAINVLNNLTYGRNETSTLPPHLISELWYNMSNNGLKTSKLVIWEAYDGGTNFRLEEISRISPETPCRLIRNE